MIIYLGVLGLCSQSLGDFEQSNVDWRLISGAPVMTSSITEENRDSNKLSVFLEVQGISEAEEAIVHALTTTTKTERLEGRVTDAGTPV
ncbi:hypothetical protein F2Q69_00011603 [Brassica cretica]|uniref:Uncharacterized protein n=1 Tax=Brassica cretica TaxID=69181 RepID=A0A8S9R4V3_BRACR|nr:hypothetical protein F2Q69_00011603 [Brassica cretica]